MIYSLLNRVYNNKLWFLNIVSTFPYQFSTTIYLSLPIFIALYSQPFLEVSKQDKITKTGPANTVNEEEIRNPIHIISVFQKYFDISNNVVVYIQFYWRRLYRKVDFIILKLSLLAQEVFAHYLLWSNLRWYIPVQKYFVVKIFCVQWNTFANIK